MRAAWRGSRQEGGERRASASAERRRRVVGALRQAGVVWWCGVVCKARSESAGSAQRARVEKKRQESVAREGRHVRARTRHVAQQARYGEKAGAWQYDEMDLS